MAAINLLIHQDYGDHGRKASEARKVLNTLAMASTLHSLVSRRVTKSRKDPRAWSATNPADLTPTWSLPC